MYQRLRDFMVPSVVLDEIFSSKEDLETLKDSWNSLKSSGRNDDEIGEEVSKIILAELDDDFI